MSRNPPFEEHVQAGEPWAVEASHRGETTMPPSTPDQGEYDREAAKLDKAVADAEATQQQAIAALDGLITETPVLYASKPGTTGRYGDPRLDYYLVKGPEGYVIMSTRYGGKPSTERLREILTRERGVHSEPSAWEAVRWANMDTMHPPKPVGNNKVGRTISRIVGLGEAVKTSKFNRSLFGYQWASRQALARVKGERQKQADKYGLKLGQWYEMASWLGADGAHHVAYIRAVAKEELQADPHWRSWLEHEESLAKHSLPIMFAGAQGGEEFQNVQGKFVLVKLPPPSPVLEEANSLEVGVGPVSQSDDTVGVLGGPSDLFSGGRWGPEDEVKPLHPLAKQAIQEVKEAAERKKQKEAAEAKAAQEAEEVAKSRIGKPAGDPSTISANLLVDVIKRITLYAATDRARPTLTCINIQKQGELLDLAAADGFRLAHASLTLETAGRGDWTANIPAKELAKWASGIPAKALKGGKALIDFVPVSSYETFVNKNRAGSIISTEVSDVPGLVVAVGDKEQSFKGILGKFPNYPQLIPSGQEWGFDVRAGALVAALAETGGLITGRYKESKQVGFMPWSTVGIAGDRLLVFTYSDPKAALVPASLNGDWTGQDKRRYIAFDASYLSDTVVRTFKETETISVGLTTESSPGTFSGSVMQDIVIMPLFVAAPSKEVVSSLVAGAKTVEANPGNPRRSNPGRNPSLSCPSCQGSIGNPDPGVYQCDCGATLMVS